MLKRGIHIVVLKFGSKSRTASYIQTIPKIQSVRRSCTSSMRISPVYPTSVQCNLLCFRIFFMCSCANNAQFVKATTSNIKNSLHKSTIFYYLNPCLFLLKIVLQTYPLSSYKFVLRHFQ